MITKSGVLRVPPRPRGVGAWTTLGTGLAVTVVIVGAMALSLAIRTEDRTASPPARTVMATAWAITGTGPDLVVVARESMRTADYSRIYLGSRVTGTGPGLLQVASDFSVPKVTGTGPDLVQVAEESRRASGAWSR